MQFCPKCSSILTPQKNADDRVLVCKSCGYSKPLTKKVKNSYRIVDKITHKPDEETVVLIDEELTKQQTMPTVRTSCPKCNHKVAYYWQVQTRSGDEGMTTFYRCTECGQTWREH